MTLALGVSAGQAFASAWPFTRNVVLPVRVQWDDGSTSEVLLNGFEYQSLPPTPQPSNEGQGRKEVASSTSRKSLVARIRLSRTQDPLLVRPFGIDSITFGPSEARLYGSNVSARCFSLGPPQERIPPPPDWFATWDESPLWKPARPAPVDPTWTYLPGAAWLWTSSDWRPAVGEAVLFRQKFQIPTNRTILRATLWVEADSTLGECYLNRYLLPWTSQVLGGKTVRASVERLIQPGDNLIALSATAPQTGQIDAAGVVWHLRVILGPPPAGSTGEAVLRPPFTLRTLDGGWIPADRVEFDEQRVRIERLSGETLRLPRPAVRWIDHWPRSLLEPARTGLLGATSPAVDAAYDDITESEGVWLIDGDFYREHLERWQPEADRLTGPAGDPAAWNASPPPVPLAGQAVRAVLASPLAGELRWDIPDVDLARQAHLFLRDGARLTGLLEPSSADRLVLNLLGGTKAGFSAEEVLRVDFPAVPSIRARQAFVSLARENAEPSMGFLGEVSCSGGPGCPESIVPVLRRIAQAMGVSTHWIKPEEILLPEVFSSSRFPVLINLDQSEAYYHTIQRPGDGHQALLQYMAQGGILIHLAPGTPFFYGRQAHSRQWALVPLGGGLNKAFGMGIGVPGDNTSGILFEIPDNSPIPLEFTCVAPAGWSDGFPRRILFPGMTDSRFRPIAPTAQRAGGTLVPLYRLSRGAVDYGLAAAAVRLAAPAAGGQAGYAVYIAWPLALATDEFGDSLLPRLLPAILDALAADRAVAR